jgi:hypothetical protein
MSGVTDEKYPRHLFYVVTFSTSVPEGTFCNDMAILVPFLARDSPVVVHNGHWRLTVSQS